MRCKTWSSVRRNCQALVIEAGAAFWGSRADAGEVFRKSIGVTSMPSIVTRLATAPPGAQELLADRSASGRRTPVRTATARSLSSISMTSSLACIADTSFGAARCGVSFWRAQARFLARADSAIDAGYPAPAVATVAPATPTALRRSFGSVAGSCEDPAGSRGGWRRGRLRREAAELGPLKGPTARPQALVDERLIKREVVRGQLIHDKDHSDRRGHPRARCSSPEIGRKQVATSLIPHGPGSSPLSEITGHRGTLSIAPGAQPDATVVYVGRHEARSISRSAKSWRSRRLASARPGRTCRNRQRIVGDRIGVRVRTCCGPWSSRIALAGDRASLAWLAAPLDALTVLGFLLSLGSTCFVG